MKQCSSFELRSIPGRTSLWRQLCQNLGLGINTGNHRRAKVSGAPAAVCKFLHRARWCSSTNQLIHKTNESCGRAAPEATVHLVTARVNDRSSWKSGEAVDVMSATGPLLPQGRFPGRIRNAVLILITTCLTALRLVPEEPVLHRTHFSAAPVLRGANKGKTCHMGP